jgi:hypothetical protein
MKPSLVEEDQMDDAVVRDVVAQLLTESHAQAGARKAFEGLPAHLRAVAPFAGGHSVWAQLEHMRLAQEDILRYTTDPAWSSPEWPKGYWPAPSEQVSDEAWERSLAAFFKDLDAVAALVRDASRDLTAKVPHGEWRTYLRQALLVADHNAYHLGGVVAARRALGAWKG